MDKPPDPGSRPDPVAWVEIGPDRAPAVLVDLAGWIHTVLAYHRVMDYLHPCWYRHPALVQALLDVRAAWLAAYRDPAGGRVLAALDWSQRHLPHLERQVRELLSRCSSTRHQPSAAPVPPVSEPELRAYAHWWGADRRPSTEPAPPPPAPPPAPPGPARPPGPGTAPGRRPLSPPATGARGIPQPRPRNGTGPTDRPEGDRGEADR